LGETLECARQAGSRATPLSAASEPPQSGVALRLPLHSKMACAASSASDPGGSVWCARQAVFPRDAALSGPHRRKLLDHGNHRNRYRYRNRYRQK